MQGKERSNPMRKLLLLCVFVAGVFVGIWLDWLAHKHRNLTYVVESYPQANLQIFPGDQITLADGTEHGIDWRMRFVGNVPCKGGNNVNPCVLKSTLGQGSYFFNCFPNPGVGNGCPDPGIQPSPTTPLDFGAWLANDFGFVSAQKTPVEAGNPGQGGSAASSSVTAVVSCDESTKQMAVQDRVTGHDLTSITASQGETVYWTSSDPFTLATTSYPDKFCSGGDPGVKNQINTSCTVAGSSGQTMKYTLQAGSCNQLPATVTLP